MSEDTSLSEFVTGDADERGDEAVDAEASEETEEHLNDEAGTEPARATYDWTPDGATCAGCGESVERRWRDDDGMVCADCKEW